MAGAQQTQTNEPTGKDQVVKYSRRYSERTITAEAWKAAGVEGQKGVVWNAANNYQVPVTDFTAEALEIIKKDKGLTIGPKG